MNYIARDRKEQNLIVKEDIVLARQGHSGAPAQPHNSPGLGTVSVCKAVLRPESLFGGVVIARAPERRNVQDLACELIGRHALQIS